MAQKGFIIVYGRVSALLSGLKETGLGEVSLEATLIS